MIKLSQDLGPERVSEIRLRLQSVGLKSTTARILVFNVLLDAEEPVTRADVVSHLNILGFDNSTIYRILSDFCNASLISQIDNPGLPRRYQIYCTED